MEVLLLGIYSFFVWLIFIKLKWLPWNIQTQVIVVIIPVVCLTATILLLNIYAPSSAHLRSFNYTVPVVSQVRGRVIEVPVEEGNRLVKKGDVLFKLDPVPYQLTVNDPGAYTQPWTGQMNLRWEAGTELFEYQCQQMNYATELMVGSFEKVDRSSFIIP